MEDKKLEPVYFSSFKELIKKLKENNENEIDKD